jgi:hypothetical protein
MFVRHGHRRSDAQGDPLGSSAARSLGWPMVGKFDRRERATPVLERHSGGRAERGASSTEPYEKQLLVAVTPRIASSNSFDIWTALQS